MLADVFFPDTVGGAGRVAYHLGRELALRGHSIHVLARNPGGVLPPSEQLEERFFVRRFFVPPGQALSLSFNEIKSSYAAARKTNKEAAFDCVCAHQSLAAIGPALFGPLRNRPLVYFFHSPWHEEYLLKRGSEAGPVHRLLASAMRKIEKKLLLRARKILVLSDYMAERLQDIHGRMPARKIARVPGGVDLSRFRPAEGGKHGAKKILGTPHDKTILLTVRNLVPRMGIENLVEAFDRSDLLRQRALLLVGGKGFLKETLLAMVRKYDLEASIKFLGRISEDDLPRYYQAADFFVLPTRALEGFGLVILEAMACGTPVLGTPVGAIPELIGPFDKRLLFEGADWPHLKNKLEELVQRPKHYHFKPEACRSYVEKNFSWERMAEAFEREVGDLCKL